MKRENVVEKRLGLKRIGAGFMAFAMSLSLATPITQAYSLKEDALLDSMLANNVTSIDLTPQTTETLSEYETLPEYYPGVEGLTPSWDVEEEVEEEPKHWAAAYLEKMVDYGYMRAQDALDPDEMLTRAEFMSVINRAYGYTDGGDIAYTDVLQSDWYYDDVAIATNAGFISGTSETTVEPLANMTRETTAFILGKNLMLPELNGENLLFEDSREVSDWSRGMVKSASVYGLMSGYDDNTFRPNDNITRAEISALVMKAVGTPILTPGDVTLKEIFGNVTITESGTVLKDTIIAGDLHISNGIGLGGCILENVVVLGRIVVSGGESNQGDASIILRNVVSSELVIDNMANNMVTVRVEGNSYIENTYVRTNAYIEDNTTTDDGLRTITIDAEVGTTVDFAGRIKEVVNTSPRTTVRVVDGTVDVMTIDESATEVMTEVLMGAVVWQLNIDVATNVSGEGDIGSVSVNASDVVIEQLPDNIEIRPGVDANINGEVMDSNSAAEYSSEPRILAGYPEVTDIAPTSVEIIFETNKPGTIYWGISYMTAGSISEEDLMKPPSYGSNIVVSDNVYVIDGYTPVSVFVDEIASGGNYYVTAILVDSKGAISPLKVDAFSTPDDTIPEFSEGYPYMSFVGSESAQVNVMATKSCKLYYAVLQAGAMMPTPDDFLAGVTGAESIGIQDLTKNKEATFTVATGLEEQKDYVLYLWLTDADGANYSEVVGLEFTTTDGTPPTFLQEPTQTKAGTTSADFSYTLDEDGIVYYIAVPSGSFYPSIMPGDTTGNITEPWTTDYAALQVMNGIASGTSFSGSVNATGNQSGTFSISGLALETAYDLYFTAKDLADNRCTTIGMMTFNTIDNTPPEFVETIFSHTTSGAMAQPYATTDITLVFSESIKPTYFEGTTNQSFLQLYTATQTATTPEAETTALNNLAKAMEYCFPFYVGTGTVAAKVRNGDNALDEDIRVDGDWVIDYRYVTVSLNNGLMYIKFPTIDSVVEGTHRPGSALNLSSGVTYGFKLQNIQDASSDANVMVPAELTLDKFTTVFAEVLFAPASVLSQAPKTRDDDGYPTTTTIRVDDDLKITPQNMTNVSDDIVYEIRMEPNKQVGLNIYYRIVNEKGVWTDEDYQTELFNYYPDFPTTETINFSRDRLDFLEQCWTPDTNGWILLNMDNMQASEPLTLMTIQGDGNGMGIGFNYGFLGYQGQTAYPKLNELGQHYQIELAYEVTSFEGSETFGEWNGTLEIDTQMYAGVYNYVRSLGPHGVVSDSAYQTLSLVSNPSDYQVSVAFTDSIPPEMGPGSPMAYPADITAEVAVSFDGSRSGTLYYALVESNSPNNLGPKDTSGTSISIDLIPDINEYYFDLPPVNSQPENWPNPEVPVLSSPSYNQVITYIDPDNTTFYGSIANMDKTSRKLSFDNLEPLTTYYLYIVTKSDNGGYSTPLVYQFSTTETQKPKYQEMKADPNTGNVTWTTHVAANLNYLMLTTATVEASMKWMYGSFYEYLLQYPDEKSAVLNAETGEYYTFLEIYEQDSCPYWVSDMKTYLTDAERAEMLAADPDYEYKDETFSIIDMLTSPYYESGGNYDHPDYSSAGYTGFDIFANNTLKNAVYSAVTGHNTSIVSQGTPTTTIGGLTEAIRNTSTGSDPDFTYIIFVMGANVNADTANNPVAFTHTFTALADFAVTDFTGPSVLNMSSSIRVVEDGYGDTGLPEEFSGYISISFDKYLYAATGSTAKFLQMGTVAPDEDSWNGGIVVLDNNWFSNTDTYDANGNKVTNTHFAVVASNDPNSPSKAITLNYGGDGYDAIEDGTTIMIFSGQEFLSNKDAVSHNTIAAPSVTNTTLILTFRTEDVVTTETNSITGVTTTTYKRYVWWESNWDADWNSGSGVNHATAYSHLSWTYSVETGGYEINSVSPNPISINLSSDELSQEATVLTTGGTLSATIATDGSFTTSNMPTVSVVTSGGGGTLRVTATESTPVGTYIITLKSSSGSDVEMYCYITNSTSTSSLSLTAENGDQAVATMSELYDVSGGTYSLDSTTTGITGVSAYVQPSTGKLIVTSGSNAKTGTGKVTVKHSSGATFEVEIEVTKEATLSLSQTSMEVMLGVKTALTASSSEAVTWSVTQGSASGLGWVGGVSKSQSFTPTTKGTYEVTATIENGKTATCTIEVVDFTATVKLPTGETLYRSSSSDVNYIWNVTENGAHDIRIYTADNKWDFTVTSSDSNAVSVTNQSFNIIQGYKPVTITAKSGSATITIKDNKTGDVTTIRVKAK